jgi:hypothetical protein
MRPLEKCFLKHRPQGRTPRSCASAIVAASIVVLTISSPAAASDKIHFDSKSFYDHGQRSGLDGSVYVAGTLTGEGRAYPNNSVSVTCVKDRGECLVVEVEQIGPNQIGRITSPAIYPIVRWNAHEVIATDFLDIMHCRRVIISIERKAQVATWIEQQDPQANPVDCRNAETRRFKWTIEDWRP